MGAMGGGTLGLPSGLPSDSILELTRSLEVGESGISGQPVQVASYDPFIKRVNVQLSRAEAHVMLQREQMTDSWKFFTGHQLSDEDLRILRNQRRPDTAINEIEKFILFAAGIERRTQQALLFTARTVEDQQAQVCGELETKKYEWFQDQSGLQFERSRAFESKLVCGLGILDYGLTRVTDPAGAPRASYCDAKDFYWPKTSKENFGLDSSSPVRWLARETWMDLDEALRKWPDQGMYLAASAGGSREDQWPDFGRGAKRPINYVVPWIMTEPLNKQGGGNTDKPGKVQILEWQEYRDEPGYYFYDPIERDDHWLNNADFRKLRNGYRALYNAEITDFDKQDHRVYYRAYLLQRRILLEEPQPLTGITGDVGYTWNVMTGPWDPHDEVYYGKLRGFMAPQRYANSMFRQCLEIMGSATKGGLLVQTDAMNLAQKRDYEETGSRPGSINMVLPGAISGNKILPKPIPQLPQGTMEVLTFCIDVMEKISGLSMSLLQQPPSNTPGVSLRRQLTAGMVLLAAEFDGLSRFRKREGYLVHELLKLLSDDRVVRIGGPYDGKAIQLTKDPSGLKYDIVLDEYDQDPNLRQYYTEQIMAIAPILVRTGNFIPEILDYVNLPAQFRQALKDGIQKSEQQKMEMAMQGLSVGGRGKPRGIEEIKADTQLKQARAVEHLAKASAAVAKPRSENMRMLFEGRRHADEMRQNDRQMNLEILGKLFDHLAAVNKPQGGGDARR